MQTTLKDLLASFSGTTPLFLLPDFVFFPQTVQPFQIFEPRYMEMVKDCTAGERMLTIPLLQGEEDANQKEAPRFSKIATMGYINDVQPSEDEKFNILVTGLVKVRVEEVESEKPYRRGVVTPMTEFSQVTDEEHKRQNILRLFQSMLEQAEVIGNLELLHEANIPLQMLAHVVISALPIAAEEKQKMLELQSLELRIDILLNFLESGLLSMGAMGPFEPLLPTHPWWN
ncbi:MAG: LON peptidase substrate-binding domain-containing protein [Fidelibacterota bacterium]|nr:MAG: LON peptidase substrate-binding domain-containing protein [Candidatus Neomarinimicrobiota bacterium]